MHADPQASALLALWNDVDPDHEDAYNEWHAIEHVPERLTVPGMLWGLRYRAVDDTAGPEPRYLTLYGLRNAAVLDSAPYQRLLSHPTPTSQRMRPLLRHIARGVYAVLGPHGLLDGSVVWVGADPGVDVLPEAGLRGRLLPDAKPLPWMQQGQAGYGVPPQLVISDAGSLSGGDRPQGLRAYRRLPAGH